MCRFAWFLDFAYCLVFQKQHGSFQNFVLFWKQEMMSKDKKPNKTTCMQNLTYTIYLGISEIKKNID